MKKKKKLIITKRRMKTIYKPSEIRYTPRIFEKRISRGNTLIGSGILQLLARVVTLVTRIKQ